MNTAVLCSSPHLVWCMARPANLFSVLSLDPETRGDEDEGEEVKVSSMPSSKKKRRKPKKDNVEALVSALSIREDPQDTPKIDPTALSLDRRDEDCIGSLTDLTTAGKVDAAANLSMEKGTGLGCLKWPLVWIDLEMTGLDLERDRILEIACIITDGKLQKLLEGPDLIINQSEELLASMGEWCQTHHTANGLVEGVRKSKVTEKDAEQEVLDFVRLHMGNGTKQPLLAGNSVYVDLMFLRKYMPNLAALFPHVVVDVSSIKALCLRWFPKDAERAPTKKKTHRALEDIKESIAELRYMQKTIFKEAKR